MPVTQMVCHAADQLRVAIGDIETRPGRLRLFEQTTKRVHQLLVFASPAKLALLGARSGRRSPCSEIAGAVR